MKKLLFLFALSLCSIAAWASDFSAVAPTGQTLYYSYSSSHTVTVTRPPNSSSSHPWSPEDSLSIPSSVSIDGYTYSVTAIDGHAFQYCSGLTCVTIPNSVTTIGDCAFQYCSGLTSITIPNSVTIIDVRAFEYCSNLTSIVIPNSVTTIGAEAFRYCSSLTSVTISNSVTVIESEVFKNCSGLTSVTIPNSVTTINGSAFRNCSGLTSVTIPNSVIAIENEAFYGCSGLTSVTIPNSVTTIGDNAFDDVFLVYYCGSASGSPWGAYHGGCFYEEGDFVYQDNTKTTLIAYIGSEQNVTIPNSVTTIDHFYHRGTAITSVTIGENVQTIGDYAFAFNTQLTTVNFNADSCTYMGGSFFDYEFDSYSNIFFLSWICLCSKN